MKKQAAQTVLDRADKYRKVPTCKRKGEAAEAAFLSRAASLGFEVAKPWGDSSQFDFIVHNGSRCLRVQVKSTEAKTTWSYKVNPRSYKGPYTKDNIDFLVVYIAPFNTWYILPIEVISGKSGLWFSPDRKRRSQFDVYREAWCLMACPRDGKCNPEISVYHRCLAGTASGECPFRG
jgi:hypothetical protein